MSLSTLCCVSILIQLSPVIRWSCAWVTTKSFILRWIAVWSAKSQPFVAAECGDQFCLWRHRARDTHRGQNLITKLLQIQNNRTSIIRKQTAWEILHFRNHSEHPRTSFRSHNKSRKRDSQSIYLLIPSPPVPDAEALARRLIGTCIRRCINYNISHCLYIKKIKVMPEIIDE